MTEDIQGIVFDVVALVQQHLVMPFRKGQYIAAVTMAELVPTALRQTYPGRVISVRCLPSCCGLHTSRSPI